MTRPRFGQYRKTMAEAGFDEATVHRNVDDTRVWRNLFIAAADAEAERPTLPAPRPPMAFRAGRREPVCRARGRILQKEGVGAARNEGRHVLACGS